MVLTRLTAVMASITHQVLRGTRGNNKNNQKMYDYIVVEKPREHGKAADQRCGLDVPTLRNRRSERKKTSSAEELGARHPPFVTEFNLDRCLASYTF
jgi:hypothetical protein